MRLPRFIRKGLSRISSAFSGDELKFYEICVPAELDGKTVYADLYFYGRGKLTKEKVIDALAAKLEEEEGDEVLMQAIEHVNNCPDHFELDDSCQECVFEKVEIYRLDPWPI